MHDEINQEGKNPLSCRHLWLQTSPRITKAWRSRYKIASFSPPISTFPTVVDPKPLFGVFADTGFERGVERSGHCLGVCQGDCRIEVGCEVFCASAADAVGGHQCCPIAQGQFGHGCGGERWLAEEGQWNAVVDAHVDERGEGSAVFKVAQHRAEARAAPLEQGGTDGGDVVEVEFVNERVVHAAVEAADVKAFVYERGADDVVVAEVARYDDGGFACCLRLFECG